MYLFSGICIFFGMSRRARGISDENNDLVKPHTFPIQPKVRNSEVLGTRRCVICPTYACGVLLLLANGWGWGGRRRVYGRWFTIDGNLNTTSRHAASIVPLSWRNHLRRWQRMLLLNDWAEHIPGIADVILRMHAESTGNTFRSPGLMLTYALCQQVPAIVIARFSHRRRKKLSNIPPNYTPLTSKIYRYNLYR